MKKVVSFSGGRTSAKLVLMSLSIYGADNVDVVYMDTGAEHPLTYKFIRDLVDVFNVNVTCLRGDFSTPLGVGVGYKVVSLDDCKHDLKPFAEMMAKYGTPYIGGMFCTDRMKLTPFKKYCDETYGKKNYETILGIRADEPKRLRLKPFISYLADICSDEKQDILDFWKDQVFDLELEEWNGNCVFCPKKSNLKLAAAQRDNPGLYLDWIDMFNDPSVRKVDSRTNALIKAKGVTNCSDVERKRYADEASLIMYRGNQNLEQLIATFDGSTGAEIKARIRGGHHVDTNSCSESCEIIK